MKSLACCFLFVLGTFATFADNSNEKIIKYLDEADKLFEQYINYDAEDFSESIKTYNKLEKHLSKYPKKLDVKGFKQRISDRIEKSLLNDDRRSAIKYIGQYSLFFPKDSATARYLEIEANIYLNKPDQMMMERSIAKLAEHPAFKDVKSMEILESLREKQLEIYAGETFAEEIQGVWVSDTVNAETGIPVFMFRVYDNGMVEMLNQSEVYSGRLKNLHKGADDSGDNSAMRKNSISPLRFSIGASYDEAKSLFEASFESKRFSQGNAEFAAASFNSAQQALATTSKMVSYGAGSTAGTISAGIIGLATSGALMIWGNSMASSKLWETTINLTMRASDKEEMLGTIEIIEKFATSAKSDLSDIEETKEILHSKFYRVSVADNVLFADKKANLFPLYCYNPYVQDEIALYDYSRIIANTKLKKKRSFLVPLYIVCYPAAIASDISTRKSQKSNCIQHNMQMMEKIRVNNLQRRNNYLKYHLDY